MNVPTNRTPEDFRGCVKVNGAMGGFGVHALAKKIEILHFLTNETHR